MFVELLQRRIASRRRTVQILGIYRTICVEGWGSQCKLIYTDLFWFIMDSSPSLISRKASKQMWGVTMACM
jgi:hypothetical protein